MTTLTDTQETITIKVKSGRYYKTFDAYNKTYRISKAEALESIENAKSNVSLYSNEFLHQRGQWCYFN